jgi:hypothetical protein
MSSPRRDVEAIRAEDVTGPACGPVAQARTGPTKRTVPSMVRFTPEEFAIVLERAIACGRPPAVYIREAALGAVPKARRVPERAAAVRELARLGNALTTLTATASAAGDGPLADRAEVVLTELLGAVRRLG